MSILSLLIEDPFLIMQILNMFHWIYIKANHINPFNRIRIQFILSIYRPSLFLQLSMVYTLIYARKIYIYYIIHINAGFFHWLTFGFLNQQCISYQRTTEIHKIGKFIFAVKRRQLLAYTSRSSNAFNRTPFLLTTSSSC